MPREAIVNTAGAPLLIEVAPRFAAALKHVVRRVEPDLTSAVDSLRVFSVCGCSQRGCASFQTEPRAERLRHTRHVPAWIGTSFLMIGGRPGYPRQRNSPRLRRGPES